MICRVCDRQFRIKPSKVKAGRGKHCSWACRTLDIRSKGTKLTFSQVCEIREQYRRRVRGAGIVKRLAEIYGLHPVSIYRITGGAAWNVARRAAIAIPRG